MILNSDPLVDYEPSNHEIEMISTNLLIQCCLKFPEHYNSATKHITNSPSLLKKIKRQREC